MKTKRYLDLRDTERDLRVAIKDMEPISGTIVQTKKTAIFGLLEAYNEEEAIARGYEVVNLGFRGGAIIESPGDCGIMFFDRDERNLERLRRWHQLIGERLKAHGLEVEVNENDVLVNGYKSIAFSNRNDFRYEGGTIVYSLISCQMSVNVALEDIKAICTKPMVKVPKGLSEFGIAPEEVAGWLDELLAQETER